jgi:hypothetical protein
MAACEQKPPSRDHMPILQNKLFQLQEAIRSQSRAAIDSLLSLQMLAIGQNSDSLLSFVYGPNDGFAFERLGDYEIFYTSDKARIDCFMMDSSSVHDRPLVLTFVFEHDMWLLKRFEPGQDSSGTTGAE